MDARSVYTPSRWPKIPSQTRKEKGGQKFYSLEIFCNENHIHLKYFHQLTKVNLVEDLTLLNIKPRLVRVKPEVRQ